MTRDTHPLLVTRPGSAGQNCQSLTRAPLRKRPKDATGAPDQFDERWLQRLLHDHPALLPIHQIEPALANPVPICLEMTLPSGNVDNLLINSAGGIVLVETKLWRNGEARREVVGQILDYAKDLARLTYDDLQGAIRRILKKPDAKLFDLVFGDDSQPEQEAPFVDAVSRNLRLGRFLLLIVGDGIQESVEELTDFLQRHLGLHFTLGLVELSIWPMPDGESLLVYPRVLARTVQIERAVIRVEHGVLTSPPDIEPASAKSSRPTTISLDEFLETLAVRDQGLPEGLRAFFADAATLGVELKLGQNLTLRWYSPGGLVFSLGVIDLEGMLMTDYCHWPSSKIGRLDLSYRYQEDLVALVPGATIRTTPTPTGRTAILGGNGLPVAILIEQAASWLAAMERYLNALRLALDD